MSHLQKQSIQINSSPSLVYRSFSREAMSQWAPDWHILHKREKIPVDFETRYPGCLFIARITEKIPYSKIVGILEPIQSKTKLPKIRFEITLTEINKNTTNVTVTFSPTKINIGKNYNPLPLLSKFFTLRKSSEKTNFKSISYNPNQMNTNQPYSFDLDGEPIILLKPTEDSNEILVYQEIMDEEND